MNGEQLCRSLRNDQRVYGIALENPGQPFWPKYFSNLGLDYVWLESEHTANNRETLAWAMQLYAAYEIAPLLRIPEISAARARMGIDAGAHGIIAPYVETVEQVKTLVGAVKYRPLKGVALEQALNGQIHINYETESYLSDYNRNAVLIIMVESRQGIQNLPDLLSVEGVDAVLIGPHDLSISLGIPEQYEHSNFIEAVNEITNVCKPHGIGVGMHHIGEDINEVLASCKRGFNLISYSGDTLFVARGTKNNLDFLRERLEESTA